MTQKTAYAAITVKEFDDDKREFVGVATTASPDRDQDIVEPSGAQYSLPIPLLWQHDHMLPVGEIYSARLLPDGRTEVKGRVAQASSPAGLAARLEEAWQSLKLRLVRGLSIGFVPKEYAMLDSGGLHFLSWEWLELSLVTIPANAEATIQTIKSYDRKPPAALGTKAVNTVVKLGKSKPAGASATKKTKPEIHQMKTLKEQIEAYEATRQAKHAEMTGIMDKSAETGETLDAEQAESYDTLQGEVKSIDAHLKRLRDMDSLQLDKAEPVQDRSGMRDRHSPAPVKAKNTQKLEPGIEFARYAMCLVEAKGDPSRALQIAKSEYGSNDRIINALDFQSKTRSLSRVMKAAVEAGSTTDETWAAPLVDYQNFAGDFVEFLRPQTILGQFGQGGIPTLNRIPFNVRIGGQTSGGSGYWVGEGKPKPLTRFDFTATELRWSKVAAISVLTEELIRFSNPSAERLVRDALAGALIERLDIDFIDPAKAAVSDVSPASITNGATSVASTATDAEGIYTDIQALWAPFIAARNPPREAVYLMDSTTALALSMLRNPIGQQEFPGLTMNGGTFLGVPVIVSDYLPTDSDGGMIVLVNARDIWLADDDQVTIDMSREASLQMDSAPTNDSTTPTAAQLVSMYQTNSVALRAERYVNWARRRASGVAYLTGVNYAF